MHGDGEGLARLSERVRAGGRVASSVGAVDAEALRARGIDGTNIMGIVKTGPLEQLASMIEASEIALPEIRTYPLAEAGDALAAVASRHVRGKIVVVAP